MTVQLYASVVGAIQGVFKGEAMSTKLANKIPGVAFSYGVVDPHDAASGAASGKRQHRPVVFTKQWGVASPQFYQAAFTNEVLTSVVFQFIATLPDGVEAVDHTITLTNATIGSSSQTMHIGQLNGPPVDSRELHEIAFYFQKIDIVSATGHTEAIDDWSAAV